MSKKPGYADKPLTSRLVKLLDEHVATIKALESSRNIHETIPMSMGTLREIVDGIESLQVAYEHERKYSQLYFDKLTKLKDAKQLPDGFKF